MLPHPFASAAMLPLASGARTLQFACQAPGERTTVLLAIRSDRPCKEGCDTCSFPGDTGMQLQCACFILSCLVCYPWMKLEIPKTRIDSDLVG
ncbi:uncharacterized protein C8Q71DRAFT_785534 [Rhodofomes roseus]|uniref:Uncharacterized protein n=1 Tax=Rhodofomes roseus TaxID=34475 RepID=A0ABQ8K136_9APHY|nr:uncharacterized protein C8Q71DRAFT_785534 [Rhodofomes roseus]KAH9830410.1 hypothetical protein C8Q71DRAFT_785534 [Rhodofomes roseus]